MLPFDFDYFKPGTLKEAIDLFQTLIQQGRQPMYFSGGTELITLGRIDLAYSDAVIDIKEIPEFRVRGVSEDLVVLGSALSLTEIEEDNLFPLLTKTVREIADHTARCKITLGGNICAQIFYREAVLPFLLAESQVVIAGPEGIKVTPINGLFNEQIQLGRGEILVQLATKQRLIDAPFVIIKRRQQWNNGYPLITISALKIDGEIRFALSGYSPFPFRSKEAEVFLNNQELAFAERVNSAIGVLPQPISDDVEGTAEFRVFVLRNLLMDILAVMAESEGGTV
jgi:aerobic carbon-monoxide dehydrogenase medium subunit